MSSTEAGQCQLSGFWHVHVGTRGIRSHVYRVHYVGYMDSHLSGTIHNHVSDQQFLPESDAIRRCVEASAPTIAPADAA